MRKFASLLTMLMLSCALAYGQEKTVSGQVKDEKGEAVAFATVTETGTQNRAKADGNGYFSIKIKDGGSITFSAAGHESKTLTPVSSSVQVTLTITDQAGVEVVVTTALGVKKRPKELGYTQTTVKGDALTLGKSPTLGNALSGKIAGLTVYNTSNSVNASPRIVLRGNRSISGENQGLLVLDGVPVPQNTINYLNPNDIESVTVLKGGQAATLYGSDGVNGALVITTKKGQGKPQVSFTHSSNFESVSFLPDFNTTHGMGSHYGTTQEQNYRPFENQQYGDAYDGSIRAIGRVLEDGSVLQVPYQNNDKNREAFWETGYTGQNDVSVSGGDASSSYYFSFQDVKTKGVVRKDEYRRDALRLSASKTYGKFKASFDATYTTDRAQRTTSDFYFFALNAAGAIPVEQMKDWQNNKFASPNAYYNDYYNNPWFELDNNRNDTRNNYFNGNLTLSLKATNWLNLNYRLGTAVTNSFGKSWTGKFQFTNHAKNLAKTFDPQYNDYDGIFRAKNDILGGVSDAASWANRINSDFFIGIDKEFGDISTKFIIGNNIQVRRSKSLNVSSSSITVPGIYNVSNRAGELGGGESTSELRKVGNYVDATFGYKDWMFLHGIFRYDMSSAFYAAGRDQSAYAYPYYGGDFSVILTEAIPVLKSDLMSYLKVRGSINRNGNDNLAPHSLEATASNGGGFPYGNVVGLTINNNLPDPSLTPEFVITKEVGIEAQFLKNRINLDATVYTQDANEQVLNVSMSSATGYTTTTLNAARVNNWGVEVETRASIIKNKNWTVDVNANFTYNENKVDELFGDLSSVLLQSNGRIAFVYAEIGQPFPLLRTSQWQRDPNGRVVIDPADGWPEMDPNLKNAGTTIPVYQVGVGFKVGYKNWTLAANAEYRGGHVIYHDLGEDMGFTGSGAHTTKYNRMSFIFPNSSYWDGSKYVANTDIPVENTIANYQGWGDYGFSRGTLFNGEVFTSSAAFWKLRDVSLGFDFPQNWLKSLKVVKGINAAIFGRNLLTLLPDDNQWTDPEFSQTNGNGQGINNSFNTPPVRQYGFTVNVRF
ncbi:MAG: SusC/RagA family TonB-linked outer membrane protein [Bacteroidetes bacterium]|nr:MAG: SusC/RagA family TonB-linked outer membrane protein [Bacteroidota bacterium]